MATAPWWEQSKSGGSSLAVRHSPDDGNYHYADDRQMGRMPTGVVAPVVIPRALNDGRSTGFDATVAGVVHVDPDAPDGGIVVDLAAVSPGEIMQAMRAAHEPHEVFYAIGMSPAALGMRNTSFAPAQRRDAPALASGYVVPASNAQGQQVWGQPSAANYGNFNTARPKEEQIVAAPPLPSLHSLPGQPHGPAPNAVQVPQPQPYAVPPMFMQPDPNMQAMLGQVLAGMSALSARVQQMEQRPAPAHALPATLQVGQRPAYSEEKSDNGEPRQRERRPPAQRLTDYVEKPEESTGPIIVGFESLNIAYVDGPLAHKAKRKVIFDFGPAGKNLATYHDVIEGANSVTLIYDTRYTEGTQFEPPDRGEEVFEVHVPHLKKTFQISSMGISYQHGCFDHIVLIKHENEQLDYEEDDERRARSNNP